MINKRTMSKDYLIKLMNLSTDREFKEIIIKWLVRYDKIVIREEVHKWH